MSNRKQNSSPLQHESRNIIVHRVTSWVVSILFSLGTAFSVCFVTARLFDYYVGDLFKHGFDAGVGVIVIWMGFPIIFVFALIIFILIIWSGVGRVPISLIDAVTSWLASIMVGLGAGYIILLMASNNLKTDSYKAFSNNQSLILFGFPFFSLVIYAIVLATLRLRR